MSSNVSTGGARSVRRRRRGALWRPEPAVLLLAALTCLVEAVLWGSEAGLWGARGWRMAAYHDGAFLPGLLGNWRPNHPAQPYAMWLTHALLHEGPGHLAGNMALLLALGGRAARRLGQWGLVALWALTAAGGAAAFAAIGPDGASMVGASGAVHGLVGAWLAWEAMARRAARLPLAPVAWTALGVVLLNLGVWAAEGGRLAWEAHAGGLLAGWAAARLAARLGFERRWAE
jgi:membrane associated rhomboid family serine protease